MGIRNINVLRKVVVWLIVLVFANASQAQHVEGYIKCKETLEPLPYAIISTSTMGVYTGISDTLGYFSVDLDSSEIYYKVSLLGYENLLVHRDSFPSLILIEPAPLPIDEVLVKGIKTKDYVKLLTKKWKKEYISSPYISRGLYTKYTKSNNKYIDFFQGKAFIMTSGYKEWKKFDTYKNWFFYIAFTDSRCSHSFATDKLDLILPMRKASARNKSYDTRAIDVFEFYRGFEAMGPLSPGKQKFYDFRKQYVQGDTAMYALYFETKESKFPEKVKLDCKGVIYINSETNEVLKVKIDYINHQHILIFRASHIHLPYLANMEIEFRKMQNKIYPSSMVLTKYWVNNPGSEFSNFVPPPRLNPAKKNLVDYEYFKFDSATYITDGMDKGFNGLSIRDMIWLANMNTKINYDKFAWSDPNVRPHNWEKIKNDLSQYQDLEKQFEFYNNKYYYPLNELNPGMDQYVKYWNLIWENREWIEYLNKQLDKN